MPGYKHLDFVNDAGLSLALGGLTNGSSTLEQAGAYGAIANDGKYIEPTFYTKVVDASGNVYLQPKQEKRTIMSKSAAYIVKDILTGPVVKSGGTATMCSIPGMSVAAKTGTTDDNSDRWLCGFTEYYVAAVWYGYDDREEVRWYSTSNPAATLWAAVMKPIHTNLDNKRFTKPSGVVSATICKKSGLLASGGCKSYTEIFTKGTVPSKHCEDHAKKVKICKESGKLATKYCPDTKYTTVGEDDDVIGSCPIHTKPIDKTPPELTLNGESEIILAYGEEYKDPRSNGI